MCNSIVYYYSASGNNRYLAEKIAENLGCECEEIVPNVNAMPLQILAGLTGIGGRIKPVNRNPVDYDNVVLAGPIWMGMLIPPLKSFLKKYDDAIRNLYFVTCCGGDEKTKDDKFGYEKIFDKVRKNMGARSKACEAMSIKLVLPDELKEDGDALMKARLTDETYKGEVVTRVENLVKHMAS
jgi:flavodoxin